MKSLFAILFSLLLTAPLRADDQSIEIPSFKQIHNLKQIYKTDGTPQILLVMHLPKGKGKGFIEAYNHTGRDISIFQFSLHTYGETGDLSFEDIGKGWSSVKEATLTNVSELTLIRPRAIDSEANEFYPKLVIHYEIGLIKNLKQGKKKI